MKKIKKEILTNRFLKRNINFIEFEEEYDCINISLEYKSITYEFEITWNETRYGEDGDMFDVLGWVSFISRKDITFGSDDCELLGIPELETPIRRDGVVDVIVDYVTNNIVVSALPKAHKLFHKIQEEEEAELMVKMTSILVKNYVENNM